MGRHARRTAKNVIPAAGALAAVIPVALGAAAPAVHAGQSAVLDAQVASQQPPARPLVTRVTAELPGTVYTVAAGDTLSGVAGKVCGDPGEWPAIWHANQAEVPDPDLIYPGQTLRFTCGEITAVPQPAAQPAPPAAAVSGTSGGILSCAGLEALWQQAGGSPGEAFMAAEIARAESGGNPDATDYDANGTADRGLWQVNSTWGPLSVYDPLANARAAVQISADGTNWSPWVTAQRNLYQGQC